MLVLMTTRAWGTGIAFCSTLHKLPAAKRASGQSITEIRRHWGQDSEFPFSHSGLQGTRKNISREKKKKKEKRKTSAIFTQTVLFASAYPRDG